MSLVNQSIIKHKMVLRNLAEELQNVSQVCRVMGVSRDTFYRVKEAKESGGMGALLHKSRRPSKSKDPSGRSGARPAEGARTALVQYSADLMVLTKWTHAATHHEMTSTIRPAPEARSLNSRCSITATGDGDLHRRKAGT